MLTAQVAGKDADATFNMSISSGPTIAGRIHVEGKTVWLQLVGEKAWRKATPLLGILLPDNGRPFEARYTAQASAGGPLSTASATFEESYCFSNDGGRNTIKAPKP